jgi:biotin-(acetyl-CoA carboxylase) ligase
LERNFAGLVSDGPQIAARANALCVQRGRRLCVQHGRRVLTGVCRGIGPDGALLLETAAGQQQLYSGVLREPRD